MSRLRSIGGSDLWEEVIVVLPWPRASMERTPALGRIFCSSEVKAAKERPDEPAPW